MASQLQNRIVGTIILVALAVIILPELLDGKEVRQQQEFEAMPLQPETDVVEQEVQLPATELEGTPIEVGQTDAAEDPTQATLETAAKAPEMTEPEPTSTTSTDQPQTAPPTESLAEPGYVIQLGAFSNAESVDKLIEQLQGQGFTAYGETVQANGKQLTRLLVGPALTETELQQQLPKLKELTGLSGRVVRFEP